MAVLAAAAVVAPADAALQTPAGGAIGTQPIGPITERYGFFPEYYQALDGTKLQACIDTADARCGAIALPNPAAPESFPGNFPDEFFYNQATATVGGTDLLLAQEATFTPGADGNQSAFGRLRIRSSDLVAGDTYRFTNPYGQVELTAAAGVRRINQTEDVGCGPLLAPVLCDLVTFKTSAASDIGPNFLSNGTGTPATATAPGFLGDGVTPAPVAGSVFLPSPASVDGVPPTIDPLHVTFTGTPDAQNNLQADGGAIGVAISGTSTDDVDGTPATTCVQLVGGGGATAPVPTTLTADGPAISVRCSATDAALPVHNTGTQTFSVSVPDTTPPIISMTVVPGTVEVPGATTIDPVSGLPVTAPSTFKVTYVATAHDFVAGNISPTCGPPDSGDEFAIGNTNVTCTANDGNGNTDTQVFTINVTAAGVASLTNTTPPTNATTPVISKAAPNPQAAPVQRTANFFRIDHISGPGGTIVSDHNHEDESPDFIIVGKTADPVPQAFFLSTGGAFGSVQLGGAPLAQDIVVRNGGSASMTFSNVTLTGDPQFTIVSNTCANGTVTTAARGVPATATPTCTVRVQYAPTATVSNAAVLHFTDTTPGTTTPTHTINLTGAGTTAAITVASAGLAFGDQTVNITSAPQAVSVSNTGGSPLHVTAAAFTGAAPADYKATLAPGCATVAAGSACNVTVTFTPTAAGVRNATLQITSDVGTGTVPVSGNGIAVVVPPGGGGGGAAVVTPPAVITPAAPGPPIAIIAKAKLKISKLTVSKTNKRSKVRKQGVRFDLRLTSGTEVVRIRILRKTAHGAKQVLSVFKTPNAAGLFRVAFRSKSQLKSQGVLGTYQVQATPGRSRTDLGVTASATYKVVRG